ncbi:S8 family serine peptidase [Jidongwangia harbinensis]|uniref:S8 family serine peptidase n=1 Tax=Jidongwangia harbinensis TaxID=2878561 RepID=UPI001CD9FF6D|nr:S8 family serine peptidase [Jidongwangia harbinensis]MCA2211833.1 S8 family serine peptidase [Jidongwangia harbinensis]
MPRLGRSAFGALLALAAGLATLGLSPASASAAEEYVKYYTVTSGYAGKPENLTEIATRFLGSGARSVEVYNLNTGRKQPDNKVLTDPGRLRPGWMLVMPWDAVGGGIQYGVLPDKAPGKPKGKKPAKKGSKPNSGKPDTVRPPTSGSPQAAPYIPGAPAPGLAPSLRPGVLPSAAPKGSAAPGAGCASRAGSSTKTDWARLRVAADHAWKESRGKGQLVAVVDSGVNASLPQLTGHVSVGLNVVDGTSRGDTDCLGTGTTMAGIIAAQQVKGAGPMGVAPDANVMPVRVVTAQPQATPEVQVRAIEGAVAAGATVLALGGYVNTADARVAKAVSAAVARNVVVVLAAPPASAPASPETAFGEGVLRVAGIGVDDRPAAPYRSGAVDVVAPAVNVAGLSPTGTGTVNGTGTHYAVAFVAAQAALVKSAYPDLTAQQVTHRIKVTAEKMGDGEPPNAQFGYGFIDPATSVTKVLAEEDEAPPPAAEEEKETADQAATERVPTSGETTQSGSRTTILVVTAVLMIAAGILLAVRIRRMLSPGEEPADLDDSEVGLIDSRLEVPTPAFTGAPPPGPSSGTGGGGGDPWDDDGGHWTDDGR